MAIRDVPGQPVIGHFSFTPYDHRPMRELTDEELAELSRVDGVLVMANPRRRRKP